jgi:hypothetical protein
MPGFTEGRKDHKGLVMRSAFHRRERPQKRTSADVQGILIAPLMPPR